MTEGTTEVDAPTLPANLTASLVRVSRALYDHGWAENHAGNISYRLTEDEAAPLKDVVATATIPLDSPVPSLGGEYFLVTAAGAPLRLIAEEPRDRVGIGRITPSGDGFECVVGFTTSKPTSELSAHLMGHDALRECGRSERALMHAHPTYVVALTHLRAMDGLEVSVDMWRTNSESLLAFPRGVYVLPWMVCGTDDIGRATAVALKQSNAVIWEFHGVFASGRDIDGVLELTESVEAAAQILVLAGETGRGGITDEGLRALCARFELVVPALLKAPIPPA